MLSKFHKIEFFSSAIFLFLSFFLFLFGYGYTLSLADSTIDLNIHDTYFVVESYDAFTTFLICGITISGLLFFLSQKKFSKFHFLYAILVLFKLLWVFAYIKTYTFFSPDHFPSRYYTNSVLELEMVYQTASILIVPILLFLILILVIVKLFSLRKRHKL